MNQGYAQGRAQTMYLPPGGYLTAPNFAGMGPYGGHDPGLSRAAGNPYSMGAGGSLGAGGGGGGVWSPGGNAATVAAGFQNANMRANNANEDRYSQILGGYDSIEAEQRAITDKMYAASEDELDDEYSQLASKMTAQFTKNGFGPNQSTAANSILQANAKQKLRAKAALFDQMARTRMSPLDTRRDKLAFMERRNDRGPDMSQLVGLMSQAGEAQGGGGGLNQGAGQLGGNAVTAVPGGYGYYPPGGRVPSPRGNRRQLPQGFNVGNTVGAAANALGQAAGQAVVGATSGLHKLFGLG